MRRSALEWVAVLALVAASSWLVRAVQHRKVELAGHASWITTDPDTLYQARRLERALVEGLPVAEHDQRLGAPGGSAIPWPPYYTTLAYAVFAPFAPEEPRARAEWVETRIGSFAALFGVLGSLLAALAARRLAGNGAALVAGAVHALCGAAIAYGKIGNGDHHAFVSLLAGAMLYGLARGLEAGSLERSPLAAKWGAAAGALAGISLGAWVASAMYVVEVQVALAVLLFVHARRPRAGTAALGLAFHLAALAAAMPAVLSSPWKESEPWMVVNLSWFHAAHLALGALVFAPLSRLSPRAARAWPWTVGAGLAVLAGALAALGRGPGAAIVRAFEWVSRSDEFMARVGESRPLVGPGTAGDLAEALGYVVFALPFAWIAAVVAVRKRGDLRLLPWAVAVPLLAAQALRQARFAEALALPMAVVLGWGAAAAFGARPRAWRLPRIAVGALALALVGLASWPAIAETAERWGRWGDASGHERPGNLGARLACDWIGSVPALEEGESVLAVWGHGHVIEWAAHRPSVATNFGSYVGDEGFRAPPRFFLEEDFDAADALLARHRARFVIVDSDLPNHLNAMIDLGAPKRRERYVSPGSERGGGEVLPPWFLTVGARMMFDGGVFGPFAAGSRPLDRLRLTWVSALRDPARRLRRPDDVSPAAWVWERVAGAVVEAHGTPGDELALSLTIRYALAGREVAWVDRARAGDDGVARLRVPYATDVPNGDGRADGAAAWTFGRRTGTLEIPERAVREGATLALE